MEEIDKRNLEKNRRKVTLGNTEDKNRKDLIEKRPERSVIENESGFKE